jgi:hypothetical protein
MRIITLSFAIQQLMNYVECVGQSNHSCPTVASYCQQKNNCKYKVMNQLTDYKQQLDLH